MKPRPKLIAVDLDGTLLDPQSNVTSVVADAVAAAAEAGVAVVCASGRSYRDSARVARPLSGAGYVIAQHGAILKLLEGDRTIHSALITAGDALALVETLKADGFEPFIGVDTYAHGVDYYIFGQEPYQQGTRELMAVKDGFWRPLALGPTLPVPGATQVSVLDTQERCRSAEALLRRRFGEKFHYMVLKSPRYTRWFLDIISPASGKGKTLMELAGLLNVQRDETAAVGDDVNDIDMFRAAGVSVAMGNATQAVQAAADFVAPTNDQDGAAEAIMGLLEGRYGKS